MYSNCREVLNIGTTEMVDMKTFVKCAMSYENRIMPLKHIEGPVGVRGRNSNNDLIKEKLGWEPSISIKDGLRKTYFWIKEEVEKERREGKNIDNYSKSKVVEQ